MGLLTSSTAKTGTPQSRRYLLAFCWYYLLISYGYGLTQGEAASPKKSSSEQHQEPLLRLLSQKEGGTGVPLRFYNLIVWIISISISILSSSEGPMRCQSWLLSNRTSMSDPNLVWLIQSSNPLLNASLCWSRVYLRYLIISWFSLQVALNSHSNRLRLLLHLSKLIYYNIWLNSTVTVGYFPISNDVLRTYDHDR